MNTEKLKIELEQNIKTEQPSKRRLIINKIAMENFKSYYGRLEIGPFHRRFTAIVGPNGSGKSNLIESLLFVFGKRANWMRLKSLHQLIHNSSQHSDIKKASVEVEFMEVDDDGRDSIQELPHTRFTVKRTVHHTGATNYHINDAHATLEEVTVLLQGKGIDLTNNRFLILQGEVEQISLMKPKSGDPDKPGFLEYLEDIVGSSDFQVQVDALAIQYESLDGVRRERGEVMRIVENEMQRMEPAKDKAVEYVRREKQAWQLQNVQFQVLANKESSTRERLIGMNEVLDREHAEAMRDSREQMKRNVEVIKHFKDLKEKIQQVKDQISEFENSLKQYAEADNQARAQMKSLTEQHFRCTKRMEEMGKEQNGAKEDLHEIEKQLPEQEQKLQSLVVYRDALEKQYSSLEQSHREATQSQLNEKKRLQQKINPQLLERDRVVRELELWKNRLEISQKPSVNLGNHKQVKDTLEIQKLKKQEMESVIPQIKEVSQKIVQARQQEEQKLHSINKELLICINQIQELRAHIQGVQQNHSSNNEQNNTVKSILDAQARGQLPGVIGRLGDLGWIPKEYDRAITTSCLGGLNAILVENDDSAQKCINFLKANKIGRQTFISLKRVQEAYRNEISQSFQAPTKTTRLFDLIRAKKDEYKAAFFKVIGNTLVCDTIETAKEVRFRQKRNFKTVTMDGKIIDNQGVMSGGGQVRSGGMCTSQQLQQSVRVAETGISEEKQKLEVRHQQKLEIEKKIEGLRVKILDLEREEQHIQKALNERQQDLKDAVEQIEENSTKLDAIEIQREQNQNNKAEIKHIEQEVDDKTRRIQQIEESYRGEQQLINEILSRVQAMEGQELKQAKEALQQTTIECEDLEQKVNKQKPKMKALAQRIQSLMQEEKDMLQKAAKFNVEKQNLNERMKEHEESSLKLLGQLNASQEEDNRLNDLSNKSREEHQSLTTQVNQMRARVQQIKDKKEDNAIQVSKATEELKEISKRLNYVRSCYRESLREYDFLQELDQIATAHCNTNRLEVSMMDDYTLLNISMVEDRQQIEDEDARPNKRRSNVVAELQSLLEFDVLQDLDISVLERCLPIEKEIARTLAHVQVKANEVSRDTNVNDITTFKTKFGDYKEKRRLLDEIKEQLANNKHEGDKIKKERYSMFMNGFNVVSTKLRETYQHLTNGGDAELELVDTMDPFSEGVSFSVRPKNKSWKQMSKLSGGEKTLASLSLIFALHHYRPTPLYFFDEVDAALDYRNVAIVGNFVKERTQNAQFIVISLRNNMFELANKLVGIYKTYDMTKSISIQPLMVKQKVVARSQEQENQRDLANQN